MADSVQNTQFEIHCSGGTGDELDGCRDVLRLDPDVPIVQMCPELDTAVEQTVIFREDEP